MMKRYATIDSHSGFVWWVGDAETPEGACVKSDEVSACYNGPRGWVSAGPQETPDGYEVFEVPAGFNVDDGQAQSSVDAVEAKGKSLGFYKPETVWVEEDYD